MMSNDKKGTQDPETMNATPINISHFLEKLQILLCIRFILSCIQIITMSSSNQAPSKKSKGRQKVTMAKMENQSNLQVTFSKRRAGLFKKASELCTLCGAEAAIVVFSPADKVYCFGHPNAKTVCDRFTGGGNPLPSRNTTNQMIIEAHRNSTIRELNLELTQVESMLRAERKRREEIDKMRKLGEAQHWFPPPFEQFSYAQLCVLKESVMRFKKEFDAKVQKEMLRFTNPLSSDQNPFLGLSLGADAGVSNVATYNGFGLSYGDGPAGFSGNELFAPGWTSNGSTDLALHDHLRGSGWNGDMSIVGGSNGSSSSSSKLPIDPNNMGFGVSPGFNIGYGAPRMF